MPENQPPFENPHKPGSVGPTVGIVIIVILLFLGALYFWGQRLNRENPNDPPYIPGDTQTNALLEGEVRASTTLQNN